MQDPNVVLTQLRYFQSRHQELEEEIKLLENRFRAGLVLGIYSTILVIVTGFALLR